MAAKKKRIEVSGTVGLASPNPSVKLEITENTFVGLGSANDAYKKLVISQPFSVLKSFTLDKHYHIGDTVSLSDEEVIKELKINKYIK